MKRLSNKYVEGVIRKVTQGKMTGKKACARLGITRTHLWRLKKRYSEGGPGSLAHGSAGRESPRKTDPERAKAIVCLYEGKYSGFNVRHFREKLASCEGIEESYSTVLRILSAAGIESPMAHKKKKKKGHPSRPRRESFGELVQIDASIHEWVPGSGEKWALHGAIDDSTGIVLALHFEKEETLAGYREMMRIILKDYGIPSELYSDNRTVFTSKASRDGTARDSHIQFADWMMVLGVSIITTSVPQAKGKIERLWKTLQSRLVNEMRLLGIRDMEGANAYLPEFVREYNSSLGVEPDMGESEFSPSPSESELRAIMSVRLDRISDNGSCFSYKNGRYQLYGDDGSPIVFPKGTRVSFFETWDGELLASYAGNIYSPKPAMLTKKQAAATPSKAKWVPSPDHPWRKFVINPGRK